MNKLNLQYGEVVIVRGTHSELDGQRMKVVGVSIRHIVDFYILEFFTPKVCTMPDGSMQYSAVVLPEPNLRRLQ